LFHFHSVKFFFLVFAQACHPPYTHVSYTSKRDPLFTQNLPVNTLHCPLCRPALLCAE
jgi:hypothetical protein